MRRTLVALATAVTVALGACGRNDASPPSTAGAPSTTVANATAKPIAATPTRRMPSTVAPRTTRGDSPARIDVTPVRGDDAPQAGATSSGDSARTTDRTLTPPTTVATPPPTTAPPQVASNPVTAPNGATTLEGDLARLDAIAAELDGPLGDADDAPTHEGG